MTGRICLSSQRVTTKEEEVGMSEAEVPSALTSPDLGYFRDAQIYLQC